MANDNNNNNGNNVGENGNGNAYGHLDRLDEAIKGGFRDDTISGNSSADVISGGAGNDSVDGGRGDDLILGDLVDGSAAGVDASPIELDINNLDSVSYSDDEAEVGDFAVYRDVATLADGSSVWGRVILTGMTDDVEVNLAHGSGSEILLDADDRNKWASFRLEFFDPVTGDPVALNSTATFNDIDGDSASDFEAVTLDLDSFTGYGTAASTSLDVTETADGILVAGTERTNAADQDAWLSAAFENRTSIEFTLGSRDGTSGFSLSGDLIDGVVFTPIEQGADTLSGGEGSDTIYGEGGDDVLDGGADNDELWGGEGQDNLSGGDGDDTLEGNEGDDTISGGDGSDLIYGGAGDDFLTTGTGDDTLFGGEGNDTLQNSAGDDSLVGGAGDDSIVATLGNDTLEGDAGNDTLDGGADNDSLEGGTGNDSLTGGTGDDIFVYGAGDGADTITDFNAGNTGTLSDGDLTNNDSIDLSAFYDDIWELHADYADDGTLNQSNATDVFGNAIDYSDNTLFTFADSLTFTGGSGDFSFFTFENTGVVCFTEGTRIATPNGDIPVEQLRVGDLVCTRDNGVQPILWHGVRCLEGASLHAKHKPVTFDPTFISSDRPLSVSPQHAMMVSLDGEEYLVRAIQLARLCGGMVRTDDACSHATYHHLMFESHQVIFAEGVCSESFYPGKQAIGALALPDRMRLANLFCDLPGASVADVYGPMARSMLSGRDVPSDLRAISICR